MSRLVLNCVHMWRQNREHLMAERRKCLTNYGPSCRLRYTACVLLSEWKLTELALRVTLRMEAYRACSTSHSPIGSLQSLLYESLSEWKLTEFALRVMFQTARIPITLRRYFSPGENLSTVLFPRYYSHNLQPAVNCQPSFCWGDS